MDWNDTPAQAAFRREVEDFIRERLPDYYVRKAEVTDEYGHEGDWQEDLVHGSDEAKQAARDWASALGERGWAAPHWPREYGGAGLTTMEQFVFHAEMAEAQAPLVGDQGLSLLGPTLLVHGTSEQKAKYLGPTLAGEMLWAQGFSEPGAGSDLASLQTRAVRDGDDYVINGQKMWTSTAHKSNWIFGLFRTDSGRPEAPRHLVPCDRPGHARHLRAGQSSRWAGSTRRTRPSTRRCASLPGTWLARRIAAGTSA